MLYNTFQNKQFSFETLKTHFVDISLNHPLSLLSVFVLCFFNWLFEALKWRVVVKPISTLKVSRAFSSVLIGLGLSFLTPRSIGDYIGRLINFSPKERLSLIAPLFINRIAQMSFTMLGGGIAAIIYTSSIHFIQTEYLKVFIFSITMGLILLTAAWIIIQPKWYKKTNLLSWVQPIYSSIKQLPLKNLVQLFSLSGIRYLIFLIQFKLIFNCFDLYIETPLLLSAIALMLLFKSLIISFNFLNDLGVREVGALFFLSNLNIPEEIIISGSLSIWIINLLIPSLIGLLLFFIEKLKIG